MRSERIPKIPRRDSADHILTRRDEADPEFNPDLEPEDLCAQALTILQTDPSAKRVYDWLQESIIDGQLCNFLCAQFRLLGDKSLAETIIVGEYPQIEAALESLDSGTFI